MKIVEKYRRGVVLWSLFNWLNLWLLPTWMAVTLPAAQANQADADNHINNNRINDRGNNQSSQPHGKNKQHRITAPQAATGAQRNQYRFVPLQLPLSTQLQTSHVEQRHQYQYQHPAFIELAGLAELGRNCDAAALYNLFIPFHLTGGALFFVNPRIFDRIGSSFEGNLHFGYRQPVGEQGMLGGFVAWDRRRLEHGCFSQLTFGLEGGYANWWLGANFYQPIGQKQITWRERVYWQGNELIAVQRRLRAQAGADLRVGWALNERWSLYLGGYYFGGGVKGGMADLEYQHSLQLGGLPSQLTWFIGGRHDRQRGSSLNIGLKLRADLRRGGAHQQDSLALRHLGTAVRRDPDIIVTTQTTQQRTLFKYAQQPKGSTELVDPRIYTKTRLGQEDQALPDGQGYLKRESDWYREHFDWLQQQDFATWSQMELQQYRQWLLDQLGLASDLSVEQLQQQWREFVFQFHPDRCSASNKAQAERIFIHKQPFYQELLRLAKWQQRRQTGTSTSPQTNAQAGAQTSQQASMQPMHQKNPQTSPNFQPNSPQLLELPAQLHTAAATNAHAGQSPLDATNLIALTEQTNTFTPTGTERSAATQPASIPMPELSSVNDTNYGEFLPFQHYYLAEPWAQFKQDYLNWRSEIITLTKSNPAQYLNLAVYGLMVQDLSLAQWSTLTETLFTLPQHAKQKAYLLDQLITHHQPFPITYLDQLVQLSNNKESAYQQAATTPEYTESPDDAISVRQLLDLLTAWFSERDFVTHNFAFTELFSYQTAWVDQILANWFKLSPDQRLVARRLLSLASLTHKQLTELSWAEQMSRWLDGDQPITNVMSLEQLLQGWSDQLDPVRQQRLLTNFYAKLCQTHNRTWLSSWLQQLAAYKDKYKHAAQRDNNSQPPLDLNAIIDTVKTVLGHRAEELLQDRVLDAVCIGDLFMSRAQWQQWRYAYQHWLGLATVEADYDENSAGHTDNTEQALDRAFTNWVQALHFTDLTQLAAFMTQLEHFDLPVDLAMRQAYQRLQFQGTNNLARQLLALRLQTWQQQAAQPTQPAQSAQSSQPAANIEAKPQETAEQASALATLTPLIAERLDALWEQGVWQPWQLLGLFGREEIATSYQHGQQLLAVLDMLLHYSEILTPSAVNVWSEKLSTLLHSLSLQELLCELEQLVQGKIPSVEKDLDQIIEEMLILNPGQRVELKPHLTQFKQDYQRSLQLRTDWLAGHYPVVWLEQQCNSATATDVADQLQLRRDAEHIYLTTAAGCVTVTHKGNKTPKATATSTTKQQATTAQPGAKTGSTIEAQGEFIINDSINNINKANNTTAPVNGGKKHQCQTKTWPVEWAQWQLLQESFNTKIASTELYQLAFQWGLLPRLQGVCKPLAQWRVANLLDPDEVKAYFSESTQNRELLQRFLTLDNDYYTWQQAASAQVSLDQAELLAVVAQAMHDLKGFYPRANQLLAAYLPHFYPGGLFSEVATGEGKSIIIALFAAMHRLETGEAVDIATSSSELSQRDAVEFSQFYQHFGWLAGDNTQETFNDQEQKTAYLGEMVYGETSRFIGDELMHRMYGAIKGTRGRADTLVLDEVDDPTIDKANLMTILGRSVPGFEQLDSVFVIMYGTGRNYASLLEQRAEEGCYLRSLEYLQAHAKAPSAERSNHTHHHNNHHANNYTQTSYNRDEAEAARAENLQQWQQALLNLTRLAQATQPSTNESIRRGTMANGTQPQQLKLADHCGDFIRQELLPNYLEKYLLLPGQPHDQMPVLLPDPILAFAIAERYYWADSLVASFGYQKDVHYIVQEYSSGQSGKSFRQALPVDGPTGVTMPMLQWGNGLHAFIEFREGLALKSEHILSVFQPSLDYFSSYEHFYGFSGTLGGKTHVEMLGKLHNVTVLRIPSFATSRRVDYSPIMTPNRSAQQQRIVQEVHTYALGKGRAVLVICDSIKEAREIEMLLLQPQLQALGLPSFPPEQLFMYVDSGNKTTMPLERRFHSGDVIIATNLAGRGADIKLSPAVLARGGLHVIKTTFSESLRVEQQAFGRSGRQGNPGSAQLILSRAALGLENLETTDQSNTQPQQSPQSPQQPLQLQIDHQDQDTEQLYQQLITKREQLERRKMRWQLEQEAPNYRLQAALFDQFVAFREQLLSGSQRAIQLECHFVPPQPEQIKAQPSQPSSQLVHCWLSSGQQIWLGTYNKAQNQLQWVAKDVTQRLALLEPSAVHALTKELSCPQPKFERLSFNTQQTLRFLVEHFWEPQAPRHQRAIAKVKTNFAKKPQRRTTYWHLQVPQYLYAQNHQIDYYLLWLLLHKCSAALVASRFADQNSSSAQPDLAQISLTRLQQLMQLAGLAYLYRKWRKDLPQLWDSRLLSNQLEEDWGVWFHGLHYLVDLNRAGAQQWTAAQPTPSRHLNISQIQQRLTSDFAQFKTAVQQRLANKGFYRNPGYLLKSVTERSPMTSQYKESDSFEHCIELCNIATIVGSAYTNSFWFSHYLRANLRVQPRVARVRNIEQKSQTLPFLQQYLTDLVETKNLVAGDLHHRLLADVNFALMNGAKPDDDQILYDVAKIEFYHQVAQVLEEDIKTIETVIKTDDKMLLLEDRILPNELLTRMNITQAYNQTLGGWSQGSGAANTHNYSAPKNASIHPFDSSQLILQQAQEYGFTMFKLHVITLSKPHWLNYLVSSLFNLAISVIGAAINVCSGGLLGSVLGYNLISSGLSGMIRSIMAWHYQLPLELGQMMQTNMIEVAISVGVSAFACFLDAVKILNVHDKMAKLNQLHGGSFLKALGLAGLQTAVGSAAHLALSQFISSASFANDLQERARRRISALVQRQHDLLGRIVLTDELNGKSHQLTNQLNYGVNQHLANYRFGLDSNLDRALSVAGQLASDSAFGSFVTGAISISRIITDVVDCNKLLGRLENDITAEIRKVNKQSWGHRALFQSYVRQTLAQGQAISLNATRVDDWDNLPSWNCSQFVGTLPPAGNNDNNQTSSAYGQANSTVDNFMQTNSTHSTGAQSPQLKLVNLTDSCQAYRALVVQHPTVAHLREDWINKANNLRHLADQKLDNDLADVLTPITMEAIQNVKETIEQKAEWNKYQRVVSGQLQSGEFDEWQQLQQLAQQEQAQLQQRQGAGQELPINEQSDTDQPFYYVANSASGQPSAATVASTQAGTLPPMIRKTPHIVQPGETLMDIAAQYDLPVDCLETLNPGLARGGVLADKSKILLPINARHLPQPRVDVVTHRSPAALEVNDLSSVQTVRTAQSAAQSIAHNLQHTAQTLQSLATERSQQVHWEQWATQFETLAAGAESGDQLSAELSKLEQAFNTLDGNRWPATAFNSQPLATTATQKATLNSYDLMVAYLNERHNGGREANSPYAQFFHFNRRKGQAALQDGVYWPGLWLVEEPHASSWVEATGNKVYNFMSSINGNAVYLMSEDQVINNVQRCWQLLSSQTQQMLAPEYDHVQELIATRNKLSSEALCTAIARCQQQLNQLYQQSIVGVKDKTLQLEFNCLSHALGYWYKWTAGACVPVPLEHRTNSQNACPHQIQNEQQLMQLIGDTHHVVIGQREMPATRSTQMRHIQLFYIQDHRLHNIGFFGSGKGVQFHDDPKFNLAQYKFSRPIAITDPSMLRPDSAFIQHWRQQKYHPITKNCYNFALNYIQCQRHTLLCNAPRAFNISR